MYKNVNDEEARDIGDAAFNYYATGDFDDWGDEWKDVIKKHGNKVAMMLDTEERNSELMRLVGLLIVEKYNEAIRAERQVYHDALDRLLDEADAVVDSDILDIVVKHVDVNPYKGDTTIHRFVASILQDTETTMFSTVERLDNDGDRVAFGREDIT